MLLASTQATYLREDPHHTSGQIFTKAGIPSSCHIDVKYSNTSGAVPALMHYIA